MRVRLAPVPDAAAASDRHASVRCSGEARPRAAVTGPPGSNISAAGLPDMCTISTKKCTTWSDMPQCLKYAPQFALTQTSGRHGAPLTITWLAPHTLCGMGPKDVVLREQHPPLVSLCLAVYLCCLLAFAQLSCARNKGEQ